MIGTMLLVTMLSLEPTYYDELGVDFTPATPYAEERYDPHESAPRRGMGPSCTEQEQMDCNGGCRLRAISRRVETGGARFYGGICQAWGTGWGIRGPMLRQKSCTCIWGTPRKNMV